MNEPIWINASALRLLQVESLAEFGGLSGMRDALKDTASHKGLFLSALARPRNLFIYEEVTNISRLAAAYAYGLARNHPFNDGNKRAASRSIRSLLRSNKTAMLRFFSYWYVLGD